MPNVRPVNEKKYNMSKYRFGELYNFCLQYNEWKLELTYMTDTLTSPMITGLPRVQGKSDPTVTLAIRRQELENKCKMVEQTAVEADADIYPHIIKAVTNEGITYHYLREFMDIPCGKDMYYDRRRKFYWLLSKKL